MVSKGNDKFQEQQRIWIFIWMSDGQIMKSGSQQYCLRQHLNRQDYIDKLNYQMGALTSRTEQDLKLYLERDYDITHYPSILHRTSKRAAIVHQITTDSKDQAHQIRSDVNLYKHLNCQSISNILEYIPLESPKICSDQQFHYIVEQDMQKYNLKEQFYARKYYKERFTDNQILNIIKAFLCGLNVYHTHFHRSFNSLIKLEALTVDQKHSNHLRLTDPLLMTQHKISTQSISQSEDQGTNKQSSYRHFALIEDHGTIRQAPQKSQIRKTKFNEKKVELNELLADIYIAGVVVLEIYRMRPFEKTQKQQVLTGQINAISNRELNKIISTMTSLHPEERGKVFELVKVSPQESYHLEKNFKNGNINPKQANLVPQHQTVASNQQNSFKKETSFSFGTSPSIISPNFPPKNTQLISSHSNIEPQRSFPLLSFDQQKNGSLSNMSTDRTIHQIPTSTVRPVSQGNFKPVINFNTGGNTKSISSISTPGFANYFPNSHHNSFSQNYISTSNNSGFKTSSFLQNRTNSFLIQQEKRPLVKEIDYSPFRKQQDMSPILAKDSNLQESNYKKIFEKYSHLNYEANANQNNFPESKKVEEQMNRLLKQSSQRTAQNQRNKSLTGHAGISKQIYQMDSPIDALEPNRGTTFTMRQNAVREQALGNNGQVGLYKPNKQVEQILKRLGIGSLLYGNENNSKQQVQKINGQGSTLKSENQSDQNSDSGVFVHKGTYNIALNPSNRKQIAEEKTIKQKDEDYQKDEDDIPDRQTTPIRPVQKNKYNSTIVQVGDQDSQYSSSGVRNTQTPIDLSNHQYVVEEYQTGSRYEGYKLNGQRDGHGKFFYQDGGYYEGQWKNNKMDGWGKLFYEGGKLAYEGNWCQDQFHGFGKVYNDNPIHLQCGFDFTNFDLLEDYWEYYEGMLVKDTKEGRGKIKLTNGEVFEGDFHNDRIQGFGKFFMKENTMIEGIWRDSKLIKIISS